VQATTIAPPPLPGVRLKTERLKAEALKRDWITVSDLANGLGINKGTISRLFTSDPEQRQNPGAGFIAAALLALPELRFEDLFEVVGPDQRQRAA
jgi:hypothetical protein